MRVALKIPLGPLPENTRGRVIRSYKDHLLVRFDGYDDMQTIMRVEKRFLDILH